MCREKNWRGLGGGGGNRFGGEVRPTCAAICRFHHHCHKKYLSKCNLKCLIFLIVFLERHSLIDHNLVL